ncbi:hypothetical protein [Terriglobus saanensis]|uniref:Uncharacterized protein n=1 Tax=Terriglobus saanensis (strain ATCC BAA-1853 / DSM 23119 / SP1PR4) TaxID=401053 RepID=E8V8D2_TERSS|nr:hypothetical protein [Terriglobus saanensis]ADV81835.1 hypothetical protein AciPR4_1002 [Terriglobus saanensis SP1PR4]
MPQAPDALTPKHTWPRIYLFSLFAAYILLVLFHHAVPLLGDYSIWTYEGVLFRNHLLGLADAFHTLKHYPVPNSATTVGIGLLALVMPWQLAAKLWLCLQLAFSAFALRSIFRASNAPADLWFILPTATFLNLNLWWGFINFQWGIALAMFFAAMLLRSPKRIWILGLMLVLLFFTHMIPFTFAALMLALYAYQVKRYRLLLSVVPSALLTLWYVWGRVFLAHNADAHAPMLSTLGQGGYAWILAYKVNSLVKGLGFINPVDTQRSLSLSLFGKPFYLILLMATLVLAALLLWAIAQSARASFRSDAPNRFLWITGGICGVAYLFLPGTALGVSDPGSRVLQVSLAVMLACITRPLPVLRVAKALSVLLMVSGLSLFAYIPFQPAMPKVNTAINPTLAGFAHAPYNYAAFYLDELEKGELDEAVFPTALFLSSPSAQHRYQ